VRTELREVVDQVGDLADEVKGRTGGVHREPFLACG
jgi:hypothetical protein